MIVIDISLVFLKLTSKNIDHFISLALLDNIRERKKTCLLFIHKNLYSGEEEENKKKINIQKQRFVKMWINVCTQRWEGEI